MKLKCPYCGSHRTETVGGPDGNPFNGKRQEKIICLDCGRTMPQKDRQEHFVPPHAQIPCTEKELECIKCPVCGSADVSNMDGRGVIGKHGRNITLDICPEMWLCRSCGAAFRNDISL